MDYLFNTMKKCEIWFPTEELRYLYQVDKKGSEWEKAMLSILDLNSPFDLKDKDFNEKENETAKNVLVALDELNKWYFNKKNK